jgi:hypothetical protein
LDVSGHAALAVLHCNNNLLTALNISGCAALNFLDCGNNQLTALGVNGRTVLEYLLCSKNSLTALDVSGCTSLKALQCYNNLLTTLNLSGCALLGFLDCYNNQLPVLDVSGSMVLKSFSCYNNKFTDLDVSGHDSLEFFYCALNQLTNLDVNGCVVLKTLSCYENELTALDLTGLTALTTFAGNSQSVSLTLDKNSSGNYERSISLLSPTFGASEITYTGGKLQSTDTTVASCSFTVETNQSGKQLSGTMKFTYEEDPTGIVEGKHADLPLRVYPNPANSQLRIANYEGGEIQIFNIMGQNLIAPFNSPEGGKLPSFGGAGGGEIVIDISHLAKGMYFLKIGNKVLRFVKE